jgi:hypothetical protein
MGWLNTTSIITTTMELDDLLTLCNVTLPRPATCTTVFGATEALMAGSPAILRLVKADVSVSVAVAAPAALVALVSALTASA